MVKVMKIKASWGPLKVWGPRGSIPCSPPHPLGGPGCGYNQIPVTSTYIAEYTIAQTYSSLYELLVMSMHSISDIDECLRGIHDCHTAAICADSVGGFLCLCKPGYEGNGTFCASKEAKYFSWNLVVPC